MRGRPYMTLGNFIAKRRRYLHLTQEQLAERLHVSKSAVAKWEIDGGIPDRCNLQKLSDELGVSINDLYRIIDSERLNTNDGDINITADIIAMLESYGYIVIRPEGKKEE